MPIDPEFERLKIRHQHAHDTLVAAEKEKTEQQLSISKDASGHFEKLAVFCGGTIALVVSFLGGHKDAPMQWHILIPASIWIMAAGMIAATARNIIYQHWAHRAYERSYLQALRDEQETRGDCLAATPHAISLQTGERITSESLSKLKQSTADAVVLINEWEAKEKRLLNWWIRSGRFAQVLALIGILSLALLATKNV